MSLSPRPIVDLIIVTQTESDEDTNSILIENVNRAIKGNVTMQVTPPGGQVCNLCKWHQLVAKFATNATDATR